MYPNNNAYGNHGRGRSMGRGQNPWSRSVGQNRSSGSSISSISPIEYPRNFQEATSNSNQTNPKFEEARKRMQEGIEKFKDNEDSEAVSSEDEVYDSKIIEKTFGKYTDDVDNAGALRNARDLLQEILTSGAAVCLICLESIKRIEQIWSCGNCYCMIHVSCIQKWAKDSMFHLQSNTPDESGEKMPRIWCCPKCRHEYKADEMPSQYFCFCGKVENPPHDPWIVPHSCGSICAKDLKPYCGHQCLLLCHPGPCPPCPKTIQTTCFCKRSNPAMKRCSNKEWSCNKPCQKLLSCAQHRCPKPCHGGECPPCTLQSEQSCDCRNEKILRPCDSPNWKCEKVCGKPLDCGNHICTVVCHSGKCGSCPKSGARPCPCNKKIMWLPCTEEVVPCGDTCDKLLECGLHKCSQRCHLGNCGICLQMRTMKCRCGQRVKSVPCCKEFICDTKCKRKRDCGKHNCNRKCCIGDCPPCEAPCTRTLNCGVHKCQSRCHGGPCFPCRETVDVKCFCGQSKITVPCGRSKSAKPIPPPRCKADCQLPADCHHEQRQQHRCHFGNCPPCQKICEKVHPCGHKCPAKCHSAVLTKVDLKKKKDGPWDLLNFKMQLVDKPCPLCIVPVALSCLGGHSIHEFPCHESRPWSCGKICGRSLSCGNHVCEIICHEESENCSPCERMCERKRPEGCVHQCHRVCHSGRCHPCKESIKMKCHCTLNQLYLICHEWTTSSVEKQEELLSCKNTCPKQLSCGHRCPWTCHKDSCPNRSVCKKKVTLRCKCKRLKKDMHCTSLQQNEVLPCDDECVRIQRQKIAEEEAKRELEKLEKERQQQLEVEEFQRKMEGRRKRPKKPKEIKADNRSWIRKHYLMILAFFVVIAAVMAISQFVM